MMNDDRKGQENQGFSSSEALAEAIASRCNEAYRDKNGWRACCPGHGSTNKTTLVITPATNRVLLYCHAGCHLDQVLGALSLSRADLRVHDRVTGTIAAVHDYFSANGVLIFQAVRRQPKGFYQRRPDPVEPGKWINDLKGVEPVLYRLPELITDVETGRTIYVVEGEQDADNLRAVGVAATCNPMGAGKWRDSYSETLRDASVVVLPDNDGPGRKHAEQVAQSLYGKTASSKIVTLPGLPEKGDVSDWLSAGGTGEELLQLVAQAPARELSNEVSPDETNHDSDDTYPVICISTDINRVVNEAQGAMLQLGPVLFQRAGLLCRIVRGTPPPKGIERPLDAPSISVAPEAHLLELASRAAHWEKFDQRSNDWVPARPPKWAIEVLEARGQWSFPTLEAVIEAPTIRPDGSVVETPGYDAATGLYFDPGDITFPPIPQQPTQKDVADALAALLEVFADFPFEHSYDRSAILAALLSVIVRLAIRGPVPMFTVSSSTRGSGKSLLVDTIATIATGRGAPRFVQPENEAEERKRLLTIAIEGDLLVLNDNVDRPLGSAPLDAALTAAWIQDRLLGVNRTVRAPFRSIFFATGNNLLVKGDTTRRIIPINLDPKIEKPEERADFRHRNLLAWVQAERPRLVAAVLTLVRAYVVAGYPKQDILQFGSYEAWSDLVRSTLVWAGLDDPNAGRAQVYDHDPIRVALGAALRAWFECFGSRELSSAEVCVRANAETEIPLKEALGGLIRNFDGKGLDSRKLGYALRRHRGRIIDTLRFESPQVESPQEEGEKHKGRRNAKGTLWCVRQYQ